MHSLIFDGNFENICAPFLADTSTATYALSSIARVTRVGLTLISKMFNESMFWPAREPLVSSSSVSRWLVKFFSSIFCILGAWLEESKDDWKAKVPGAAADPVLFTCTPSNMTSSGTTRMAELGPPSRRLFPGWLPAIALSSLGTRIPSDEVGADGLARCAVGGELQSMRALGGSNSCFTSP